MEEGRRLLRLDKGSHSRDPPQTGTFFCSVASAIRDVAPASSCRELAPVLGVTAPYQDSSYLPQPAASTASRRTCPSPATGGRPVTPAPVGDPISVVLFCNKLLQVSLSVPFKHLTPRHLLKVSQLAPGSCWGGGGGGGRAQLCDSASFAWPLGHPALGKMKFLLFSFHCLSTAVLEGKMRTWLMRAMAISCNHLNKNTFFPPDVSDNKVCGISIQN